MAEFGLKDGELSAIVNVLAGNGAVSAAAIFGSRAKGNHKPYSDIDIVLYGDLDISDAEKIVCELDELPLVYKFDVLAYKLIKSPALLEHIERVGAVIYEINES